MLKLVTALSITTMLIAPAAARTWHHGHHASHHRISERVRRRSYAFHENGSHFSAWRERRDDRRFAGGGRPRAWCGWEMRRELGVADRSYNLARNWAHYGSPAGGPAPGVIVVWSHHVGRIEGECGGGWLVHSGNDGGAVRTRCRSVRGAIAFRYAGFGGYSETTAPHYRWSAGSRHARRYFGYRSRSIAARIKDRGRVVRGRIVDLMASAGHASGFTGHTGAGVSRV